MDPQERIILAVLKAGPKSCADLFLQVLVEGQDISWHEAQKKVQMSESVDMFQRAINRLAKVHAIGIRSDLTIYRDPQYQLV